MIHDFVKETNDTHGILNRIVFNVETRINNIKRAEVTNHAIQRASDWSGESYYLIITDKWLKDFDFIIELPHTVMSFILVDIYFLAHMSCHSF